MKLIFVIIFAFIVNCGYCQDKIYSHSNNKKITYPYSKFHISVSIGISYTKAVKDIKESFIKSGYGHDKIGLFGIGKLGYPLFDGHPFFFNINMSYNINNKINLGIDFEKFPNIVILADNFYTESASGKRYSANISYNPKPVTTLHLRRSEFKYGFGISFNQMSIKGEDSSGRYNYYSDYKITSNVIGFHPFVANDYYITKNISLLLTCSLNILPQKLKIPTITGGLPNNSLLEHNVNLSSVNFIFGLSGNF